MNKLLLIPLILVSITLQSFAEDYYYVEFYRGFLNPYAQDYPQRRKEALSKAQYLPEIQKELIREIVVDCDLTFMSYANSFRDLWRLRYKDKWEPEVLIAVADTAKFYIRFCDTDIESGFSKDVGILHHILQQLRESGGLKAKMAFRDLAAEIKSVKDKGILKDQWKEDRETIKANIRQQTLELQETLNRNFREALKKALLKSALKLKNRVWQNKTFVWNAKPLSSKHPTT